MPKPRIIKKYPNRRLYDTETSTYITLSEVKGLVLAYENFQVVDAKTNDDLTRAILLQIILEEESGGVPMFSSDMLGNIIRYYGHAMQGLMGNYLERSIGAFHEAQKKFQENTRAITSPNNLGNIGLGNIANPLAGLGSMGNLGGLPGGTVENEKLVAEMLKMSQGLISQDMGQYVEKSTKAVIGMQEELSRQALKMFSAFPYISPESAEPTDTPAPSTTTGPAKATRRRKAQP